MERTRIKSNNLRSVGYDESVKILEIEFDHGGIYQYFGVPKKIFEDLMKSESSYGQFHTRYIKNRYRHQKTPDSSSH
jgi:hypothetical protein